MPITRGAIKKLKQDKKRAKTNLIIKKKVKEIINKYKHSPSPKLLNRVFSLLDNASKKKIYHANKVARIKSRLSSLSRRTQKKSGPFEKIVKTNRKNKSS